MTYREIGPVFRSCRRHRLANQTRERCSQQTQLCCEHDPGILQKRKKEISIWKKACGPDKQNA